MLDASTVLARLLPLLGIKGVMRSLSPCQLLGNYSYSNNFASPAYRCEEREDFWIGYAINTTKPFPEPLETPLGCTWNNDYVAKVLEREMFNATYLYILNWRYGAMLVEATRRSFSPLTEFSEH